MTRNNAYKIFELKSSCTDEEINKQFKKLAMKHHPDKGGNPENFKLIVKAKEVLLRKENVININGREYTGTEYEELLKRYRNDLESLERAIKKQRLHTLKLLKFRAIIIGLFVSKWIVLESFGYHNAKQSLISLIVFGILQYMVPTMVEVHNNYLTYKRRKK